MRPSTSWRKVPASNGMPSWSSSSCASSRKRAPTPSLKLARPVSRSRRPFHVGGGYLAATSRNAAQGLAVRHHVLSDLSSDSESALIRERDADRGLRARLYAERLAGPFLRAIDIIAQPGRQRDLGHGVAVCGDHPLTALVTTEGEQLGEEATVEHGWVAAMVTPTRHDDPAGRERPYQCVDHLHGQIRLVGHTDQGGLRRLRKRPQADGDRSADALFRMRILNRCHPKAGECSNQARVRRDHNKERFQTAPEEATSGLADQWLTTPRFE